MNRSGGEYGSVFVPGNLRSSFGQEGSCREGSGSEDDTDEAMKKRRKKRRRGSETIRVEVKERKQVVCEAASKESDVKVSSKETYVKNRPNRNLKRLSKKTSSSSSLSLAEATCYLSSHLQEVFSILAQKGAKQVVVPTGGHMNKTPLQEVTQSRSSKQNIIRRRQKQLYQHLRGSQNRVTQSIYTWSSILFIALILATYSGSLLSLSSGLLGNLAVVNSANVNNNNIQLTGANLMKATVVSSSSSSSSSLPINNGQQTNGLLVGTNSVLMPTTKLTEPQASSREIEKQIVDKILGEGYDKRIRPAGSGPYNASRPGSDGPTIVKVNTLVRSISKIDDVTMEYSVQLSLRQEWTDDRLAFGKMSQYRNYGLNSITLTEQERLWKPDLFFRNEKEGHFHKIIMPNVLLRIKGEGQVLYSIRISLVLACPMDLKYYPLDKQNCTIEMASYGYLDEDLKFLWKENNPVQIAKPLNLPRFTLETYDTAYCTSRTTTGAYSCLRIDLIFKREFSYYLIQIYIPCCMLVIVSWVSFWLDPNAIPARVSLGVTTLLTMATQISGINASLPPVSYTKAIDVWTGVCLTFVFGALLEFALVNYASRSDQHKREMLTSALTQTQQMRWREATAAAAAAGVAPPTSPPPDENSPSMLATKQPTFFGPFLPLATPHCAHITGVGQPGVGAGVANGQLSQQQQQLRSMTAGTGNTLAHNSIGTGELNQFNTKRAGTSSTTNRGVATVDGTNTNYSTIGIGRGMHVNNGANSNNKKPPSALQHNSSNGNNNNSTGTGNRGGNVLANNGAPGLTNNGNIHPSKMTPQLNSTLQYLKSPRDIHLMSPKPQKRKNWCKMWLAKFPTRSKRIDVISRIFFPLKFALFNLVYWTTYLFREEDTVA